MAVCGDGMLDILCFRRRFIWVSRTSQSSMLGFQRSIMLTPSKALSYALQHEQYYPKRSAKWYIEQRE